MHDSLTVPDFLDSFNPALARQAVLSQLVALNSALSVARRIDADLPLAGDLVSSLTYEVERRQTYLNSILPHMLAYRRMIFNLASIDKRFAIQPSKTSLSCTIWTALRADETYHSFKFLSGKIIRQGWKLEKGKADHEFGSVDTTFSCLEGKGKLTVIMKPGDSATCQIVEEKEMREVVVKKIVCDGLETGEMSDAKLTRPASPSASVAAPPRAIEGEGDDELPF